jgi:two-component system response regulator MprA
VVDDDDDIRDVMQEVLVAEGFEVDVAKDGREALNKLEASAELPLILLDMMMPNMDGEAFLKELRCVRRLADAHVIIISGSTAARERAVKLETTACLVKPFELDELLSLVRKHTHAEH